MIENPPALGWIFSILSPFFSCLFLLLCVIMDKIFERKNNYGPQYEIYKTGLL